MMPSRKTLSKRKAESGKRKGGVYVRSGFGVPTSAFCFPLSALHRGVTLIELLVVMAIFAILAAIAVPMIQPALESRRAREAARAVSVYLGSARNRAMETGRPCGVILRRMDADVNACMVLEQAEVPAPYGGDTTSADATVYVYSTDGGVTAERWSDTGALQLQATLTDATTTLIHVGDYIQFNNQGYFYLVRGPDSDNNTVVDSLVLQLSLDDSDGKIVPWPLLGGATPAPLPFVIHRQPTKSAAVPMQLPATAVIDLTYSGTSPFTTVNTLTRYSGDVTIMFSPNGSMHEVRWPSYTVPVLSPLYLLVGRRQQVGVNPSGATVTNEDEMANWQILSNFWVGINTQTGMVTTAEVAPPTSTTLADAVVESREFAAEAQSMGGR